MRRLAPTLVLVSVTSLLLAYGRHHWSWLAGPLAAVAIWALDRVAETPGEPAPVHARRRTPAPVD